MTISFTDDAIHAVARIAHRVNSRSEDIGARRLHTVMEKLLEEVSFSAPEMKERTLSHRTPITWGKSSRDFWPTRISASTSL